MFQHFLTTPIPSSRFSSRSILTAIYCLSALVPAQAQTAPTAQSKGSSYLNYDIREEAGAAPAKALTTVGGATGVANRWQDGMDAARADLIKRVPTLQTELNPFGTTVEIVDAGGGAEFLTPASGAPRADVLRGFLSERRPVWPRRR